MSAEKRAGAMPTRARVPERIVQAQVIRLFRSVGAHVWVLGTTRRRSDYPGTMQTPGYPDLSVFCRGEHLYVECKAQGGRLSMPQQQFRACCLDCGVRHLVGGVDQVLEYLVSRGLVREVPQYRQLA